MTTLHSQFNQTLGESGVSQQTYPYGPQWGDVKSWKNVEQHAGTKPLPMSPGTTRRLQYADPGRPTLRYPGTYVPPPSENLVSKLHITVKLMPGDHVVPVTVKSTGNVADVIKGAIENLRASTGTGVDWANVRITSLFSESGRALAPGYKLHSQGQVPFVKDGAQFVLKVFY